jgi:hypothetical protein
LICNLNPKVFLKLVHLLSPLLSTTPGFFAPVYGDMDQCPLCHKKLPNTNEALNAM